PGRGPLPRPRLFGSRRDHHDPRQSRGAARAGRPAMKLGTVNLAGRPTLIARVGDGAGTLEALYANAGLGAEPESLNAFIARGAEEMARARDAIARGAGVALLDPDTLVWLPPQPSPSKIVGVAFNNVGIRKSA